MSKYCELKLTDVLREEKREMTKKRSKNTDVKHFPSEKRHTKTKLGNLSLLKKNANSTCDVNNDMDTRMTRLTNKSNVLGQVEETDSANLKNISGPKTEIRTGKRKSYDHKIDNDGSQNKKICSTESSHMTSSSKTDKKTAQRRKRKRKSRESCWEDKLTGARRVSKRLSNLRIEKQKSLKDLGTSAGTFHVSVKSKQPINFTARGNIKSNKELHGKSHKRSKSSSNRNYPEVQINFGKLSHTKRLYPKIAAGRRPAQYTITIKPSGSIRQNSRIKRNTLNETFTDGSSDDNDLDVNSLIDKCVENIKDDINIETVNEGVSKTDTTAKEGGVESNAQSKCSETIEESCVETIAQSEVQNLVSDIVDDEDVVDSSAIIIVDIESNENIKCRTSGKNERNEQNSESGKSEEERKTAEKQLDLEKPSEDVNIINSKQAKTEEKCKDDEINGLNKVVSEIDTEPESTGKGKTPAENLSENSVGETTHLRETIDITNTAD